MRLRIPAPLEMPSPQALLIRSLHRLAGYALMQAGFEWEPRRRGELQLGLWRKRWKPSLPSKSKQKRPQIAATAGGVRRLVFLPGFGDTPMSWISTLTLLTPTFRKRYDELVLMDFPGFAGFLSRERAFHSIERMQESVFDALDSLRPQTLLGHSLGGYLSALYAIECAEKKRPKARLAGGSEDAYSGPAHLILVAPSGVFSCPEDRAELARKFQEALNSKEDGLRHVRAHLFANEPIWFRLIAQEFSEFFRKEEIRQFVGSMNETHELAERAHAIGSQIFLIWGEQDSLIPTRCMPEWLSRLEAKKGVEASSRPPVQGIVLKGVGHSPQIEAPAAIAAVLNEVFSKISGRKTKLLHHPFTRRWWETLQVG